MVRLTERQIRFDESSVDRQSLCIPNARIRRCCDIFPDCFDVAIADDDRGVVESFTGFHDHFAADESMNSDRAGTKTRRKDFGESSRDCAE